MIGSIIYPYLSGDTTISAIFGNRIYPLKMPEMSGRTDNIPFVRYEVMSITPITHQGVHIPNAYTIDVGFGIYANTYLNIQEYTWTLIQSLYKFRGNYSNTYNVRTGQLMDYAEDYVELVNLYGSVIQFQFNVQKII